MTASIAQWSSPLCSWLSSILSFEYLLHQRKRGRRCPITYFYPWHSAPHPERRAQIQAAGTGGNPWGQRDSSDLVFPWLELARGGMVKHVLRCPVPGTVRRGWRSGCPSWLDCDGPADPRERPPGGRPVLQHTAFLWNLLLHDRLTAKPGQLSWPKGLCLNWMSLGTTRATWGLGTPSIVGREMGVWAPVRGVSVNMESEVLLAPGRTHYAPGNWPMCAFSWFPGRSS